MAGRGDERRGDADPRRYFTPEELARSREANAPARHARWNVVFYGVLGVLVMARFGPWVTDTLDVAWPVEVVAVTVATYVLMTLATLPFEVAAARHRRRWDLDRRPVAQGPWGEAAGFLVVGAALPLFMVPMVGVARLTPLWWLAVAGLVVMMFVTVNVIGPRVLRGEGAPLDDPVLLRRLVVLAREAGVPAAGVWVRKASHRTGRMQLYLIGFGRRRRIVVPDSLVEQDVRVVEATLAHQIALVRRIHAGRTLLIKTVSLVFVFWVVDRGTESGVVREIAGTGGAADPAGIPLVWALFCAAFGVMVALTSLYGRARQRRFTADALDITRDPDACEEAIRMAARVNLEPLEPRRLQRLWSDLPTPAERLAIVESWRRSRRLAVVFTDIVDSTRLLEEMGERDWYELLTEHNEIVRSVTEAFGGTEVDNPGDGFLLTFPDTGQAVLAALETQRRLADLAAFAVRVGIHAGDVIQRGSNIYGREVHFAARIAAAARGGEVLVSGDIREELAAAGRFQFGPARAATLKGFEGEHTVVPVRWEATHEPAEVGDRLTGVTP